MAMINFPENEKDILEFWKKEGIFKKTVEREPLKGEFVFYEGPPTANGKPGVHHVLSRAFKDAIPRYKTMRGYRVNRKAGWDTHGLPVELQVEKQLGISGKPEIETLKGTVSESVSHFNEQCKSSVWEYKDLWEEMTERMGYWIDLEHPYITYENEYIASVWSVLKKISEREVNGKKLIYKDYRVSPYCYHCGTVLSSHEVAQGYADVVDTTVIVAFDVVSGTEKIKPKDRILVWTTTPWTVPGNVALAVGADMEYVIVKASDGERYVFAKTLHDRMKEDMPIIADGEIEDECSGADIVGARYKPIFNIFPNAENAYRVYAADFVTTEDGTGIVHMAPMYGEDDFAVGKEHDLPFAHTVDPEGKFISVDGMDDKEFHDAVVGAEAKNKKTIDAILELLAVRRALMQTLKHEHSYPHCWRCGTPLLYYATPSWYIRMTELKEDIKALNEQVDWVPKHIQHGRFGEWLENVKDWAISRARYWGTPLPIWANVDDETDWMVCSLDDVRGYGVSEDELKDLHKPYLDDISFVVDGKTYKRVSEVLDVWFDSGAMPWAQHHVDATKTELFGGQYPAGFIAEAIDQTRGWFYTLMAIAALMEQKKPPYEHVICLGHINDAKGKKMSKSKGNIVDPFEMMDKYGADAVRWHLYTVNAPGESKNFDEKGLQHVLNRVFLPLYNTMTFWDMYKKDFISDMPVVNDDSHALDIWQFIQLKNGVAEITESLEAYDIYAACGRIEKMIDDTSTWFLRRSRERIKAGDESAITMLGYSIRVMSELLAPFAPFISETIWQKVTGVEKLSVHESEWPSDIFESVVVSEKRQSVWNAMQITRIHVIPVGLAERAEKGIKVRQPLASATVSGKNVNAVRDMPEMQNIMCDELNVKKTELNETDDDVNVVFDTNITPELEKEGVERELIRLINAERKKAKLQISDIISATYSTDDEMIVDILESGSINDNVLVKKWNKVDLLENGIVLKANDREVQIRFEK